MAMRLLGTELDAGFAYTLDSEPEDAESSAS